MSTQIKKVKKPSREIKDAVRFELWGKSAGRCQYPGCQKPLWKHEVSQLKVNLSEAAHIYAFSEKGTRGGILRERFGISKLNDVENLMLVCDACHKTIDTKAYEEFFTPELLHEWKAGWETHVEQITGIPLDKKSHVLVYSARIGDRVPTIEANHIGACLFPDRFPAKERPFNLTSQSSAEDNEGAFWQHEVHQLEKAFRTTIVPEIEAKSVQHLSVFAFAPQPLLILLGSLISEKIPADIYQRHRIAPYWKWRNDPEDPTQNIQILRPSNTTGIPVLVMATSFDVHDDRVRETLKEECSIWKITLEHPNPDHLKTKEDLTAFSSAVRGLLAEIEKVHKNSENTIPLRIFPASPIACSIQLGRTRHPHASMPWKIYNQTKTADGKYAFTHSLTIK